jgi:regulatory protein
MKKSSTIELISKLEAYCSYQERCFHEIHSKLISLEANEKQIEEVFNHLTTNRFFDQMRFVQTFINGKMRINKWGKNKIKAALIQKKVEQNLIFNGLENIDNAEYDSILQSLIQKKMKELTNEKNEWIKKQKVLRFLNSKGFDYETILNMLD